MFIRKINCLWSMLFLLDRYWINQQRMYCISSWQKQNSDIFPYSTVTERAYGNTGIFTKYFQISYTSSVVIIQNQFLKSSLLFKIEIKMISIDQERMYFISSWQHQNSHMFHHSVVTETARIHMSLYRTSSLFNHYYFKINLISYSLI